jgi:hypothetical protein
VTAQKYTAGSGKFSYNISRDVKSFSEVRKTLTMSLNL